MTAFRDGIMALAEGDLAGFAASLGQQFADHALTQLGEQLFDQMFGSFNAAAEGATQGASMAATVGPAIATAGATAAAAMAAAITTAGATAAAAMAAAVAGGKVLGIAGLASGGMVRGPGSPTSDSIPAMLSNGEFVVRAAAVQKHRGLLEAINRGMLPAFARGGLVATNEAGAPESFYPS